MFISVLDLFKIGIGPSSSHTMGPMIAAHDFLHRLKTTLPAQGPADPPLVRCTLKGSLAFTGKGHNTDRAVALGLHGYSPDSLGEHDIDALVERLWDTPCIRLDDTRALAFSPSHDIIFDRGAPLPQHPNGMIFEAIDATGKVLATTTYFSIGGGFINTLEDINQVVAPVHMEPMDACPYPFDSANSMLTMSQHSGLSIAEMKRANERVFLTEQQLDAGLDRIWEAMNACIEAGLSAQGQLPGGLNLPRRAKDLHTQLTSHPEQGNLNDWLCAYAMAVNEENAAGHRVVTAPTNGAAGVIPAVLRHFMEHAGGHQQHIRDFLLTAAAIGGIIKHKSSISGAEVGCQGEVGSASAMAAAALCAIRGGNTAQIENAAEIALEHHLGMTCDPVNGLVQVPCIERNGFGAIKAHTAASLALRGSGQHFMPLDNCIAAMKQTGLDMSEKYKETALGGLAVNVTEC